MDMVQATILKTQDAIGAIHEITEPPYQYP